MPPELTPLLKRLHLKEHLKDGHVVFTNGSTRYMSNRAFALFESEHFIEHATTQNQRHALGDHLLAIHVTPINSACELAKSYASAMNTSTTALFGIKLDHSTSKGDGKGAYQVGGTKTQETWLAHLHYRNLVFRQPLSHFALVKGTSRGNADVFVVSPLALMEDGTHAIAIKLKEHGSLLLKS